jgi:TetR/AcrR family transcriptional regulator, copper-responsive repressor
MKKEKAILPAPKPRGRPRAFDRAQALQSALELFWKRGYEATSISDLKEALGIESPSLYSAFGSKEGLFRECVELYAAEYLAAIGAALFQSKTAKAGMERLLAQFAAHYAGGGHPKGCLVVSAATNCSASAALIEADLKRRRSAGVEMLQQRIKRGLEAGEFSGRVDAGELARFYSTVLLGMAMRARDGATQKELEATAKMALLAWP